MSLEEGADDYLNKPFDPFELVARIRAVLRRTQSGGRPLAGASRLVSGPLTVDRPSKRTLNKYGYPPDKQQKAIDTVLKQAEALADYWVEQ